ncbi:MAG TPA: heavy metal translocating P-type ATPase [Gemmatimonadales bacterium]|nr:heavy metal translocating P-type ATPase [Gemmatimonadales bacterium]
MARTIGTPCAHCGLAVPPALVQADGGPSFCCAGCGSAYEILHAGGLARYYELGLTRDIPVRSSGRSYDEFDHPAFEELYVRRTPDGLAEAELYLEGVHCASCVWLVERVPLLVDGVARIELDVRRALARVQWRPEAVPLSTLARTLDRLGYAPHPFRGVAREAMRRREDRQALVRIGVAGAIAGNVMLPALALYAGEFQGMERDYEALFRWVSFALTIPALLFPGRVFFTGALAALRTRSLHIDLPIAIALAAGFVRGAINTVTDSGPIYFDGVTTLIFLLLTGRYLQQRGQRAAADAAELLFSLAPGTARVIDADGATRDLPAVALLPGMELEVRAGETFPADGAVVAGRTTVNAALLTGESRPVAAATGDAVYAGTLNVAAPVRVRVEAAGSGSRLARLLREVEESAARRAPVVALTNRLSGVFVGVVLLLAGLTFALWFPRDPAAAWDHAIALLVVTCPCALALATPLAVTVAVGRAAGAGIYVKGGDALEHLARPGEMILDKTGTLTEGRTALVQWHGAASAEPLVLALEAGSAHPIADGFRRAWAGRAVPVAVDVQHVVGGGISGVVDGRTVHVGSPAFVAARADGSAGWLARLDDPTLTPVLVAVDGTVVAIAGLGDQVRDDTASALAALRARGWRTLLCSGDDPRVAEAVGRALGFGPDEILGGATPEAKRALVEHRRAAGVRPVVMVGDGVNDAAAIAAADVGIGVHGGAEASLASADAYLTTPGLAPLVAMVDGSARTMRVIRRNIAFALGYNALGVALAMLGVLSPLIAAVMMPASSVTVVLASWLGRSFEAAADRGTAPHDPALSPLRAAA